MIDLNHLPPRAHRWFYGPTTPTALFETTAFWTKPSGISWVYFLVQAGGAGGGAGYSAASTLQRGGGGGGGGGGQMSGLCPAVFCPDVLQMCIGQGGAPATAGGHTILNHMKVGVARADGPTWLQAHGGSAGGTGTGAAGGSGGTAGGYDTPCFAPLFPGLYGNGTHGGAAGGASGVGSNAGGPVQALVRGGAGGAGIAASGSFNVGGEQTEVWPDRNYRVLGGQSDGARGGDGYAALTAGDWSTANYIMGVGGAGGASSANGTGGAGGDGAYGGGGGGGGGGVTGGAGGRGGHGYVLILAW